MTIEKRDHVRYSRSTLTLNVARPGIAGFLKLTPTSRCIDFSLSGLQFSSNQKFRMDEKLILDLIIGDVELYEASARVIQCDQEDGGTYYTRVKFTLDTGRMKKPEVMHALLKIEDCLRLATEYPT